MLKAFGIFEIKKNKKEIIAQLLISCLEEIEEGKYFLNIKEEPLNDIELYNLIDKNKKDDGQYYFRCQYCNRQEIEKVIRQNYKKFVIEIEEQDLITCQPIKLEELEV